MDAAHDEKDSPGVLVFPPLIMLTMVVFSLLFGWLIPLHWIGQWNVPVRIVIGLMLFAGGITLAIGAQQQMKRHGTNVHPGQPTLSLVRDGWFAHTRNPIYVGVLLAYLGVTFWFGLDWAFVFLFPGFLVIHYGVVLREERYLEKKFGESYRSYKAKAPRYLLSF